MWYIMDAAPGANIYAGLSEKITPDDYERLVKEKKIMDVVARHDSHAGDVFFLPAGRIHAIGAGNLLAEIQETSDITYRVYDFDRRDAKTGLPRQLHVEEAKDAIDYTVYPSYVSKAGEEVDGVAELVKCSHFDVKHVAVEGKKTLDLSKTDSFLTVTCLTGAMTLTDDRDNTITLRAGESALVPAMATSITLQGNAIAITTAN